MRRLLVSVIGLLISVFIVSCNLLETPTPVAEQISIQPFLPGKSLMYGSLSDLWSPDSKWIFLFEHDSASDGTRLRFVEVATGTQCEGPFIDDLATFGEAWLADSTIIVFAQEALQISTPCAAESEDITHLFPQPVQGIRASSPDHRLVLVTTGDGDVIYDHAAGAITPVQGSSDTESEYHRIAWSPQGTRLAFLTMGTEEDEDGTITATLHIIAAASGEEEDSVSFRFVDRHDHGSGMRWLDADRLIMYWTAEGPLLITVGQGKQRIGSELIGMEHYPECSTTRPDGNCDIDLGATGTARASGEYHLITIREGWEMPFTLYHSESGETESFDQWPGLTADGEHLFMNTDEGIMLRPVDSPDSAWVVIPGGVSTTRLWSPDSRYVGVISGDTLLIYRAPDGSLVGQWTAEGYEIHYYYWSPDSRHIVINARRGGDVNANDVFLIDVPE